MFFPAAKRLDTLRKKFLLVFRDDESVMLFLVREKWTRQNEILEKFDILRRARRRWRRRWQCETFIRKKIPSR